MAEPTAAGPTRLRLVREEDLDFLEWLRTDPDAASGYGWFGYRDPGRLRRARAEHGLVGPDGGTLAVVGGDELLGDVSWRRQVHGPVDHCWAIGIALAPEARGRGHGSRAQRLLVEYLFAHTQVNRVEAETDVTNAAEQRALEHAGFTREGVVRGAQFRNGAWHDMVRYGILRADLRRPAP